MPGTQATFSASLIGATAVFASVFVWRLARRRLAATVGVALLVSIGLYLLSVLAWRLHAPVSAGDGG